VQKISLAFQETEIMMIDLRDNKSIDTDRDLGPEERHIVQKLFAWASIVESVDQFRELRKKAMADGWNNSGPVSESHALSLVVTDLEDQIRRQLKNRE
jgi:hypothetical protein